MESDSIDDPALDPFALACLRAEKTALHLIARAEQNIFGLSRKLAKRGHDSDCIHTVIARLGEAGLVDDRRYARLWLGSRINRQASSPRRLFAALCSRGIDHDDAEAALKETLDDEAEQQLLERYAQKLQFRQKSGEDDSSAAARRALRYTLKSEGFSSVAIQCFFDNQEL
ncbi:MAG: recombination regulator RecX [Treponema sp.]|nr:recombination regulator RecX [Treponema sp.]